MNTFENGNTSSPEYYDVIIVGAGLAGLCLAYQLRLKQPQLNIKVFEQFSSFKDDKTWSFHESDLSDLQSWLPFISYSWPGYDVHFSFRRHVHQSYATIDSKNFYFKMTEFLGDTLQMGVTLIDLNKDSVTASCGTVFKSKIVIDARSSHSSSLEKQQSAGWGFQKFLGIEMQTKSPHGLMQPIIMDATVPQTDGYRFIYVLPFTDSKLLIEDTYYSNSCELNEDRCRSDIYLYANKHGWDCEHEIRIEKGILPIPTTQKYSGIPEGRALKIGAGAGFFHPVTGYSFLWAVRVAETLAGINNPTTEQFNGALKKLHQRRLKNDSFYLLLNRLMFWGSNENNRKNIFERFYKFPENVLRRFYAGDSSYLDRCRILIGKPPIPIFAALKAIQPARRNFE